MEHSRGVGMEWLSEGKNDFVWREGIAYSALLWCLLQPWLILHGRMSALRQDPFRSLLNTTHKCTTERG